MSNFQTVLRQLRLEHNLTQDELATKLGISKSTVSMYENGNREPDFETMETIANFFNVDMDFLLGRTDCPTKTTNASQKPREASNSTSLENADQDIRRIQRARKDMTDEKKEQMMQMLEIAFGEYFKEDDK